MYLLKTEEKGSCWIGNFEERFYIEIKGDLNCSYPIVLDTVFEKRNFIAINSAWALQIYPSKNKSMQFKGWDKEKCESKANGQHIVGIVI